MADDNFLSNALGTVTGGGNLQGVESELESDAIQEGEQLFQQKTGIDVANYVGGSQGQSQGQDDSQSDDSSDDDSSDDSSDDDSSN